MRKFIKHFLHPRTQPFLLNNLHQNKPIKFTKRTTYNKNHKTHSNTGEYFILGGLGLLCGTVASYYVTVHFRKKHQKSEREEQPTIVDLYKQRFEEFADVVKDNEHFMSFDAFSNSILKRHKTDQQHEKPTQKMQNELAVMFELADGDKDGLISFPEYSFFLTLLTSTPRQFQIAFKVGFGS